MQPTLSETFVSGMVFLFARRTETMMNRIILVAFMLLTVIMLFACDIKAQTAETGGDGSGLRSEEITTGGESPQNSTPESEVAQTTADESAQTIKDSVKSESPGTLSEEEEQAYKDKILKLIDDLKED